MLDGIAINDMKRKLLAVAAGEPWVSAAARGKNRG